MAEMIWRSVKGKILYRRGDCGWEYSDDKGTTWYRTMRTDYEVAQMCECDIQDLSTPDPYASIDLEVYGDTLDEPLPEDLIDMILSI